MASGDGSQATRRVFLFDKQRRLPSEGRIDNCYRTELVKTNDARDAIDALLNHKEVAGRLVPEVSE